MASFIIGENDFVIHFFPEKTFQTATDGNVANLKQGNEIILTLSANSTEEVDEWALKVKKAGGQVFSEPAQFQQDFYGCSFSDLDGHKWNVLYNMKE